MLTQLSHYSIGDREAIIFKSEKGYCVRLFENKQLMHDKDVSLHTLQYAEDCAENWVHKYGNFREST